MSLYDKESESEIMTDSWVRNNDFVRVRVRIRPSLVEDLNLR